MTEGVSMIGGAALGLVIAIIARRWPFPKNRHWVWQLPIFAVVLVGMTIWAWNTGNNDFPATFGPFILAQAFVASKLLRGTSGTANERLSG